MNAEQIASELITITGRLAALIRQENKALKTKQPRVHVERLVIHNKGKNQGYDHAGGQSKEDSLPS